MFFSDSFDRFIYGFELIGELCSERNPDASIYWDGDLCALVVTALEGATHCCACMNAYECGVPNG